MEEKMNKLKDFIQKYGCDLLEDGTKEKILHKIEEGDKELAFEILQAMDKDWISRTRELGKFFIFTDYSDKDRNGQKISSPVMFTNYMDLNCSSEKKIPVLRRIQPRVKYYFDYGEDYMV